MPFTLYHFGPAIAVKSVRSARFSMLVFAFTQLLIDLEVVYWFLRGENHPHRFFHSFTGAVFITAVGLLVGKPIGDLFLRNWRRVATDRLKAVFCPPRPIPWPAALAGAFFGAVSHVVLDGLIHADQQPFFPFVTGNPLVGRVGNQAVYGFCLVTGAMGVVLTWRSIRRGRKFPRSAGPGS